MKKFYTQLGLVILALLFVPLTINSQRRKKVTPVKTAFAEELYSSMEYRSIGPHRGGRSAAVTGVPGEPNLFYFGAAGGGVWKTTDSGQNWKNISDGFFGGSIGAISASLSDPNILYVGTGEKTVRGNVSPGYGGFWRSDDAGETWEKMNLDIDQVQVGRIAIHPKNPDIVYITNFY